MSCDHGRHDILTNNELFTIIVPFCVGYILNNIRTKIKFCFFLCCSIIYTKIKTMPWRYKFGKIILPNTRNSLLWLALNFSLHVDFVLDLVRYSFWHNLFFPISDKQWHYRDWNRVRQYHLQCNMSHLRYFYMLPYRHHV